MDIIASLPTVEEYAETIGEDEETAARILALAQNLNVSPEEIKSCAYGENSFEVSSCVVKEGTSPREARELVATLRVALDTIASGPWTYESVRETGYATIEEVLEKYVPESLEIGTHDVLNTLHFLCTETDTPLKPCSAQAHRDTIREAFRGIDIKDRRTSRQSNGGEYLILTDLEADSAWDDSLNCYLDDCVLPELEENLRMYFDEEKWKRDARMDGRGHCLSGYDGNEAEEEIEGETFYIYRTN